VVVDQGSQIKDLKFWEKVYKSSSLLRKLAFVSHSIDIKRWRIFIIFSRLRNVDDQGIEELAKAFEMLPSLKDINLDFLKFKTLFKK